MFLVSEGELVYVYDNTLRGSRLRTHAAHTAVRGIASEYYLFYKVLSRIDGLKT